MEIRVPEAVADQLVDALTRAGVREVGGVMMGEHVEGEVFSVVEVTVQREGTVASFVRLVWDAVNSLKQFFAKTGHQYRRFNYLGEWHSHPSFRLHPSDQDSDTMWGIVDDPEVGANFVVLLIVRLQDGRLDGQGFGYLPGKQMQTVTLVMEGAT
jgi:proteasome lid subunit RPN8/RPN11